MFEFASFLPGTGLAPHGYCLLWQPGLLSLHVTADALIGLSYYSIPLALGYFVRRRKDLAFGWVFWLFAAFILACGTTHFMEIWTLWYPDYLSQGLLKALTAGLSVTTAVALWPLIPRALAVPSAASLRAVNRELQSEVEARTSAVEALQREIIDRQRTEEALRQSQKMEGLGQLTGGVAHDFNNILLILQGNLHLLRQRPGLAGDAQMAAMERALARGESLTRQLLTFARRQTLQPRVLDLVDEMPKLAELLGRSLRGDITVDLKLGAALWPVRVDPSEFELALINIASNARDAMPQGGTLTISVANERIDGDAADCSAGAYVRVTLADTGVGMDADTLARAFEPFFTTKEAGRGTGLGLAQVYGFAKQAGGLAAIDSQPGSGTRVTLLLPRASAYVAGSEDARVDRADRETECASETILLVEDNAEVAEVSALLLQEFGYHVQHARDSNEALAVIESGLPIDLIFSDVMMPGGLSGIDLARMVRKSHPHLPVLLTSGYSAGAAGAHAEGFSIMPKPYRADALQRALRNMLGPAVRGLRA